MASSGGRSGAGRIEVDGVGEITACVIGELTTTAVFRGAR